MIAEVKSMALNGLEGYLISIQVDISSGLPRFEIVGLPDTSVRESKERVKIAIKNSGVELLSRKIIVNLAPANTRKEGSMFDLPIAVGILIASNNIENINISSFLEQTVFIGELSLDGNLKPISGILSICIEAKKLNMKRIILPKENASEASIIEGIDIIPVNNLKELKDFLDGKINIKKEIVKRFDSGAKKQYEVDFLDVKGQESAKRALEIAAAGGHNCLLIRRARLWQKYASEKITNNTS